MTQQWFYSKHGQQQGPVSSEQLKQLAASGQLQPTDLVWKDGMGQWVEARKVKGLFPAQAMSSPQEPQNVPQPEATPPQWFFSNAGQRQGPVSAEHLKQLAAAGQLLPSDLVWKEGMTQWVEARTIKGVIPEQAMRPPQLPSLIPPTPNIPPSATAAVAAGQPYTSTKAPVPPAPRTSIARQIGRGVGIGVGSMVVVVAVIALCIIASRSHNQQSPSSSTSSNPSPNAAGTVITANDNPSAPPASRLSAETSPSHSTHSNRLNGDVLDAINETLQGNDGTPPEAIQGDAFIAVPQGAKRLPEAVIDESFFPTSPWGHVELAGGRLGDVWVWSANHVRLQQPNSITSTLLARWGFSRGRKTDMLPFLKNLEPSEYRWRARDGHIWISGEFIVPSLTDNDVGWRPVLKFGTRRVIAGITTSVR